MSDLTTILQNSEDMKTKWTTYVAFPYSRAYANALLAFKDTKGAQDKLNAKKAELGLLALTICSGGVLTHVFAQTAWKAVLKNKALDVICANNMEKAFNVAHFVSTNKAANFVVGGLWDTGAHLLDAKTKAAFNQSSASFPSTQQWKTETDALTSLMGFVNECYLKYRDAARSVFGNSNLSGAQRETAIKQLTGSNFAKPPSESPIDETKVSNEIELLFYLRIVMDLDYVQEFSAYAAGGVGGSSQEGPKVSIQQMPGDKNYPKPISNVYVSPGGRSGSVSGQNIGYEDLGRAFYDKINVLHKILYGKELLTSKNWDDFFNATMNKTSFLAAHQAIQTLETQGMTRFKKTLTAGLNK